MKFIVQNNHTQEKTCTCGVCVLEFSQISGEKNHLWTHTDKKKFGNTSVFSKSWNLKTLTHWQKAKCEISESRFLGTW